MKHQAYGTTDVGRVRDHNEDAFLIDKELSLYIVCDGCGGHAAGEVAAQTTCKEVRRYMRQHREVIEACRDEANLFNRGRAIELVKNAILHANETVYHMAEMDESKKGMACTLVMALVMGRHCVIASVGDSRVYLIRSDKIYQITEDHTIGVEYLKKGLITPEQLNSSRRNALITRVIGQQLILEPDVLFLEMMSQDQFILCSDGLTLHLNNEHLLKVSKQVMADKLPQSLIGIANECGGQDNITSLVIETIGSDDNDDREVERKFEILKRIPLFKHLFYLEMIKLLNITSLKKFNEGDVIIQEGAEDSRLFVCLKGKMIVQKTGQTIAELGEGDFFGELSLIDKSPRSATVIAASPCQFLQIERNEYLKLLNREPHMAIRLLWPICHVLSHRLRKTSEELAFARDSMPETPADALHMLSIRAEQ